MKNAITIIGCGNINRSDDGAGIAVITALKELYKNNTPSKSIKLVDAGTDGMSILMETEISDQLIIIDACTSQGAPGSLYKLPASNIPPVSYSTAYSLHDFRWDNALSAARQLYGEAIIANTSIYLIEAKTIDYGLDMSSEVSRAVQRLMHEIDNRLSTTPIFKSYP